MWRQQRRALCRHLLLSTPRHHKASSLLKTTLGRFQTTRFLYNSAIVLAEQRVLICGDGNLSYSASISAKLQQDDAHLTATVLETKEEHGRVYKHSLDHVNKIQASGHTVCFGVDATRLESYWQEEKFDLIQFNFPHVRGKTNARYNRILLQNFFESTQRVLKPSGHVCVALMNHQGGAYSTNIQEWKQSWMPAKYAAQHGLLLTRVESFETNYHLSSYRGQDRTFNIRGDPQLYVFATSQASDCRADEDVQLFCHFNVYLFHDNHCNAVSGTRKEMQYRLQQHVQNVLPHGWRGQVLFVRIMKGQTGGWICVYKILFLGEAMPICQQEADHYRTLVQESMVADKLPLLLRRHWRISNPYPSSILASILQADRAR